jgi:hypothetical protein
MFPKKYPKYVMLVDSLDSPSLTLIFKSDVLMSNIILKFLALLSDRLLVRLF